MTSPNTINEEAAILLRDTGFLSAHTVVSKGMASSEFVCIERVWYDRVMALLKEVGE